MEGRREAAFIEEQLRTGYAEATPAVLEAKRSEQAAAERTRAAAQTALASLGEAVEAARKLRAARRDAEGLELQAAAEAERESLAHAAQAEAAARRQALAASLRALEKRLAESGGDAERQARLQEARPLLRQLAEVALGRGRLEDESREGRTRVAAKRRQADAAAESVPRAEKALAAAEADEQAARERREALRREHAAHELRLALKPGDPCPVCTQPVVLLPPAAPLPDAGDADVRRADQAVKAARKALADAQLAAERLRGEAAAVEAAALQAEKLLAEAAERISTLRAELGTLGFTAKKDPAALLAAVEEELQGLEKARSDKARLEADHKRLQAEHGELLAKEAAEAAKREEARRRRAEVEGRRASAGTALADAQAGLSAAVRRGGLPTPEARDGSDEADFLESRREGTQRDALRAAEVAARLAAEAAAIERDIARAAELRDKRRLLDEKAALAQSLALHLRADQFLAYVQE
jgi:hypothetical protein